MKPADVRSAKVCLFPMNYKNLNSEIETTVIEASEIAESPTMNYKNLNSEIETLQRASQPRDR